MIVFLKIITFPKFYEMRNFYLMLFYFLSTGIAVAQDTIYLNKGYSPIEDAAQASFYKILEPQEDKKVEILKRSSLFQGSSNLKVITAETGRDTPHL